MLVHQNPVLASAVFDAISSGLSPHTIAYQVAVAYVTREGAQKLVQALITRIGQNWTAIPKTIVTCFDFGHTEPAALEYLQSHGFEVRIANLGVDGAIQITSGATSFHPKVYLAYSNNLVQAVIGSANLSRRAFSVNTETIMSTELSLTEASAFWNQIVENSVELTPALLDSYRAVRPSQKNSPSPDEPPVPHLSGTGGFPVFRYAVENSGLSPNLYTALWVEAGAMSSGGSGNQLELPRYGNRFFGFNFGSYDDSQHPIGEVSITATNGSWDCRLAWHGDNGMERIYLPTTMSSGLEYAHRVILFQRSGTSYEIVVDEPGSPRAQQWHDESAAAGTLFRLGERSNRVCGLI